jgi:transposase
MGTIQVVLEADAPRVNCPAHGPTVRQVPWARHGAGHTRSFDQQVAWLATQCSKTAITELMRIAWRTVGSIIARVWADTAAEVDAFAGLQRIGIDEISYKRRHKYLTVVVDHDSGRLVWAHPGHQRATVRAFFDALEASGQGRCAQITHVSADGAEWIADVVADRCPDAIRCADPFHVVGWATEALDAVRREAWTNARRGGHTRNHGWAHGRRATVSTGPALALRRARYALWKNPENLTDRQRVKLEWIAKTDPRLYRAYLLKEGLRTVFKLPSTRPARRWTGGSPGRGAAASNRSLRCNVASLATAPRSSPPSLMAYPTGSSNRSTPRSDSSPAWPSASLTPAP